MKEQKRPLRVLELFAARLLAMLGSSGSRGIKETQRYCGLKDPKQLDTSD